MEAEAHGYLFTYIVLSRQLWSAYYMSNMVIKAGDGKASKSFVLQVHQYNSVHQVLHWSSHSDPERSKNRNPKSQSRLPGGGDIWGVSGMSPHIFMVLNALQVTFIVIILRNFLHRLLKLPRDELYPNFTRERGASRTQGSVDGPTSHP